MVLGRTFKRSMKAKSKFTLKKKSTVLRKSVKKYLSKKDHIDFGDISEVLRHFKLFFKAVIDIDNEEYSDEQRTKYDMKKDRILDKLDNKIRYKTIIKIFEGTSLIKRKLWWLTSEKIEKMNNEELIKETFKLIPDLEKQN